MSAISNVRQEGLLLSTQAMQSWQIICKNATAKQDASNERPAFALLKYKKFAVTVVEGFEPATTSSSLKQLSLLFPK